MLIDWKVNILQMSSLSTLMSQFKAIWIKFPASFSWPWENYFKIYKEKERVSINKAVEKKKLNRVRGLIIPDIKTFRQEQQLKQCATDTSTDK